MELTAVGSLEGLLAEYEAWFYSRVERSKVDVLLNDRKELVGVWNKLKEEGKGNGATAAATAATA